MMDELLGVSTHQSTAVLFWSIPSLMVILLGLVLIAIFYFDWKLSAFERDLEKQGITGPPGDILVGNMRQIMEANKKLVLYKQLREWHLKYGSIFRLRNLTANMFVISNAEAAKAVYNGEEFNEKTDNVLNACKEVNGSLFVLSGDEWKRHRKIVQPAFGPANMKEVVPVAVKISDRLFNSLQKKIGANGEVIVNLHSAFSCLTMDVIGLAAFSNDFEQTLNSFRFIFECSVSASESTAQFEKNGDENWKSLKTITRVLQILIYTPKSVWAWTVPKTEIESLYSSVQRWRTLAEKLIVERKKKILEEDVKGHACDVMDRLIRYQLEEKGALTDEEIREELLMFMLAGHDSTANTMTFVAMNLLTHPQVFKKAKSEVLEVIGKDKLPTWEDIIKLNYLDQIIKETQRMYTVGPIGSRKAKVDTEVCGIKVPKGSWMLVNLWSLHRDSETWGDDPDEFKPERWDGDKPMPKAGSFLPFGDGPRNCIGKRFAIVELKVVIAMFLQRFEASLEPNQSLIPQQTFTIGLKDGMLVKLKN